jgi:VanZ family protein
VRVALAATVAAVVLAGSLVPLDPGRVPSAVAGVGPDKVAHALGFGLLAATLALALEAPDRPRSVVLGGGAILAVALGAGVEVVQPAVGRSAERGDLLADAVGALLGVAGYRLGHRWVHWR